MMLRAYCEVWRNIMSKTLTGQFNIGFRRDWSAWQRDLAGLLRFARDNDFSFLDVGPMPAAELTQIAQAGVGIGSMDLYDWPAMACADAAKQQAAIDKNEAAIRAAVSCGVQIFFVVIMPENPAEARSTNFTLAVAGWSRLASAVAELGAKIVIEGWPGRSPHYASLACTPADYRAFLRQVPSNVGINFDPSHLIRMGCDPLRFVKEFAPRIWHVHAKDTVLLPDGLYEHGNLQPATFEKPHEFGGHHWRYAIPGRGKAPWRDLLAVLAENRFGGKVSIELEDEEFCGTAEGEQEGLLLSRRFLEQT